MPVFSDIASLARYIAAAGVAGARDVSAFLRVVTLADAAQLDVTQLRMARAAIAGRGRNSRAPYDLQRARAALVRLAQGDVTLPANALGQRIVVTENDPSDTTIRIRHGRAEPMGQRAVIGRVVEIDRGFGGHTIKLIVERDEPSPEGWPRATMDVPADAELTLVAGPEPTTRIGPNHVAEAREITTPLADPTDTAELTPETGTDPSAPSLQPAAERAAAPAAPAADERVAGVAGDGPWTRRITIELTGDSAVVSGTGRGDPPVLRQALKDNGFWWRPQEGHVWKFVARRGRGPSRDDAVQAVRDALAELDAQEAAKAAPAPSYPPTAQQQAIIDACLEGRDVAVRALAGTGKTSTMRMVAAGMPDKAITYIAFNRSIADEAQAAFGRNVRADTMHAFARQALRAHPRYQDKLTKVAANDGFPTEIAAALGLGANDTVGYGRLESQRIEALSLVRLALAAVKRFRESSDAELGLRHVSDGAMPGEPEVGAVVLDYARRIWADKTSPTGDLRFTHDDYLKIWALGNPTIPGDVIVFDEVQDVNELQARLVQAQPAQTIVVGDSYQSIYGFRGAKDFLHSWPAEVTLPLTQSWRFGSAVADTGNRFLRLLRSPLDLEGNPALDTRLEPVEDPDVVLCRTNAGAVAAVFAGMEEGKRVALVGGGGAIKDIARAAKDLQRGRSTRHPELAAFASWDDVRDYVNQHDDAQSLRMFVQLIDRHSPDGLIEMANDLVAEDATDPQLAADLVVSTAHKAKGREWNTVRIADDFRGPTEDPETGETVLPSPEELRLAYVTVTRAQQRLELGSLEWILSYSASHTEPAATPAGQQQTRHQDAAHRHAADAAQATQAIEQPVAVPGLTATEPTPAIPSRAVGDAARTQVSASAADVDQLINTPNLGRLRWEAENMSDQQLEAAGAELSRRHDAGWSSGDSLAAVRMVHKEQQRRADETPRERLARLESTPAEWAQDEYRAARRAWVEKPHVIPDVAPAAGVVVPDVHDPPGVNPEETLRSPDSEDLPAPVPEVNPRKLATPKPVAPHPAAAERSADEFAAAIYNETEPELPADTLVLPLDGPMRSLLAAHTPDGAAVGGDGRSVNVTDLAAFSMWLDAQAAQREQSGDDKHRLRRAAVRLRTHLDEHHGEPEENQRTPPGPAPVPEKPPETDLSALPLKEGDPAEPTPSGPASADTGGETASQAAPETKLPAAGDPADQRLARLTPAQRQAVLAARAKRAQQRQSAAPPGTAEGRATQQNADADAGMRAGRLTEPERMLYSTAAPRDAATARVAAQEQRETERAAAEEVRPKAPVAAAPGYEAVQRTLLEADDIPATTRVSAQIAGLQQAVKSGQPRFISAEMANAQVRDTRPFGDRYIELNPDGTATSYDRRGGKQATQNPARTQQSVDSVLRNPVPPRDTWPARMQDVVSAAEATEWKVSVTGGKDSGGHPFLAVDAVEPGSGRKAQLTWHTRATNGRSYRLFSSMMAGPDGGSWRDVSAAQAIAEITGKEKPSPSPSEPPTPTRPGSTTAQTAAEQVRQADAGAEQRAETATPQRQATPAADVAENAEAWLYAEGASRSQARAFGAYYANHVDPGTSFSAAKRQFDHGPRASEDYRSPAGWGAARKTEAAGSGDAPSAAALTRDVENTPGGRAKLRERVSRLDDDQRAVLRADIARQLEAVYAPGFSPAGESGTRAVRLEMLDEELQRPMGTPEISALGRMYANARGEALRALTPAQRNQVARENAEAVVRLRRRARPREQAELTRQERLAESVRTATRDRGRAAAPSSAPSMTGPVAVVEDRQPLEALAADERRQVDALAASGTPTDDLPATLTAEQRNTLATCRAAVDQTMAAARKVVEEVGNNPDTAGRRRIGRATQKAADARDLYDRTAEAFGAPALPPLRAPNKAAAPRTRSTDEAAIIAAKQELTAAAERAAANFYAQPAGGMRRGKQSAQRTDAAIRRSAQYGRQAEKAEARLRALGVPEAEINETGSAPWRARETPSAEGDHVHRSVAERGVTASIPAAPAPKNSGSHQGAAFPSAEQRQPNQRAGTSEPRQHHAALTAATTFQPSNMQDHHRAGNGVAEQHCPQVPQRRPPDPNAARSRSRR